MHAAMLALLALLQDKPTVELRAAEVVEWMSKHSKVRFVSGDLGLLTNRKITITPESLDPARAYETGLKVLKSVDLAAVSNPETPGVVEIVPAATAGKKTSTVHTSIDTLPKGDEFCTLAVRLKHASPPGVQAVLINLASFPQNCLYEVGSSTLILSDYATNLRRMAEVARQLDMATPPGAFRIAVTVLEATKGGDPAVPEAFRDLDLPKSTGFARFKTVGETLARFEVAATRGAPRSPAPTEAILRIGGPPPLRVELGGSVRTSTGVSFERFTFLLERADAPLGVLALQTRVEFRSDAWVLVGVAPGESQLSSLVVIARAVPER